MPTFQELEAERKASMDKMSKLLDRRQNYANYIQQGEQEEIDRSKEERRARNLNIGDEALSGAVMGGALGAGDPIKMGIGAVAGAVGGGYKAYKQRRADGHGKIRSFLGTLLDVPNMIPGMESIAGNAPAAAAIVGGKMARNQQTDLNDALKGLAQPGQPQGAPNQYFEPESERYRFKGKYGEPGGSGGFA